MDDQQFDPTISAKNDPSTIQPLSEDNDTPFSPPEENVTDELEPTHQSTDSASNLDSHELYDEGLSGAAEAGEPNRQNAIEGYSPTEDLREDINK